MPVVYFRSSCRFSRIQISSEALARSMPLTEADMSEKSSMKVSTRMMWRMNFPRRVTPRV